MQPRTAIFSKLVRDFMNKVPLAVSAGTSLGEAVERMVSNEASSVTVIGAGGEPIGIVTEQDFTRRAVFKLDRSTPVSRVMTQPVDVIGVEEYLYYAIARMRRSGRRHMPVVDEGGRVVGMLDLHEAVAAAAETMMREIDILTQENSIDGLKHIKAAQAELAEHLILEHLPATDIQALLTHINNDIYRRIADRALKAVIEEGGGAPPVKFSIIVMGSGGRGENFLFPDQDNGMILDDYPDDRHDEIDAWFIRLAERMTHDLDAVGLPLCKGYVMATNPLWRKKITQWKEQIRLWSHKRNTTMLRLCSIFFDFRCVWGDPAMAADLRQFVTATARGNHLFLRELYEDEADHGVALGWFGRFITEADDPRFKGQMNLKHTGTLPLIEAMRLLALREGIPETSTLKRMETLKDKNVLTKDEHDHLAGAYRHISFLLLRQQLSDFKAKKRVSNYVHPESLTERERDLLTEGFKAIRELRNKVQADFTGQILGPAAFSGGA